MSMLMASPSTVIIRCNGQDKVHREGANGHKEEQKERANGHKQEQQTEFSELVRYLPRERGWISEHIHKYQGCWYSTGPLEGLMNLQQHFRAQPGDVLLVSYPKSGTTWLKALLFSLINRAHYDYDSHPLLTANPHGLVPLLEQYATKHPVNPRPESSIMSTHIPYTSLPRSILTSGCLMVYVVRDPKDVLVSCWHFINKLRLNKVPPKPLAEAFDQFSRGDSPYGPYWDHVVDYWRASQEWPDRVIFLRYEEMKRDPCRHAKRLAEFLGLPFSVKEEEEGIVQKIVELCSFEKLSSLEVNKTGSHDGVKITGIANNIFFRKGEVGDSKNHLSREMMELLGRITEQKFEEFGLAAGVSPE